MTKQNYASTARVIKELHDDSASISEAATCRVFAHRMADIFVTDNPRFSRELFYRACGLTNHPEESEVRSNYATM